MKSILLITTALLAIIQPVLAMRFLPENPTHRDHFNWERPCYPEGNLTFIEKYDSESYGEWKNGFEVDVSLLSELECKSRKEFCALIYYNLDVTRHTFFCPYKAFSGLICAKNHTIQHNTHFVLKENLPPFFFTYYALSGKRVSKGEYHQSVTIYSDCDGEGTVKEVVRQLPDINPDNGCHSTSYQISLDQLGEQEFIMDNAHRYEYFPVNRNNVTKDWINGVIRPDYVKETEKMNEKNGDQKKFVKCSSQ